MLIFILSTFISSVSSQACNSCQISLASFRIWAMNEKNQERINTFSQNFCSQKWVPPDCLVVFTNILPELNQALLSNYLSPERFCSILGACPTPIYTEENFTQWEQNVMAGSEPYFNPTYGQVTFQFAQINDIHFDQKYVVGSTTQCSVPPCCRGTFSPTTQASQYGDYNCDIPFATVNLATQFLSSQPLDFVIWTGDTAAHDNTLASGDKLASIQKVTYLLYNQFGKVVPVYPIFGSHDTFLTGQFNFTANSTMTKKIAAMWAPWIGTAAASSLAQYGRYSLIHRNTNLKIVAINTLACDYKNLWLLANVTDPGGNLQFLYNELKNAENNMQFVYIIGHIAPGSSSCLGVWSKHYQVIVRRFANIIRGQFFGHEHLDEIRLSMDSAGNPIGVQFIAPALSSFDYINPSIRVYTSDFDTKAVKTYSQYRLNLNKQATQFEFAYDFLKYYLVSDMFPATLLKLVNLMKGDEMISMKFVQNKFTMSTQTPSGCDARCRSDLACEITSDRPDVERTCKGLAEAPGEYFLSRLYGDWIFKN